MDKIRNLLDAFSELGATSATLGEGYTHLAVRSDDALKLLARELAVTPESRADGAEHWLSISAKIEGGALYVTGPMHPIPTSTEAA